MRRLMILPALAFALAAGPALASSDDMPAAAPKANWMTIPQITEKLTAQGYQVRQIKTERNGYEVYAIDRDGRRLEAYVDPVTGALAGTESGEDD